MSPTPVAEPDVGAHGCAPAARPAAPAFKNPMSAKEAAALDACGLPPGMGSDVLGRAAVPAGMQGMQGATICTSLRPVVSWVPWLINPQPEPFKSQESRLEPLTILPALGSRLGEPASATRLAGRSGAPMVSFQVP